MIMEDDSLKIEIASLESAVETFSTAMKVRLNAKARMGWRGWDVKENEKIILGRLAQNVHEILDGKNRRTACVNLANLAMMIWFLNLPTVEKKKE